MAVLAATASQALQTIAPATAVLLNPLNRDARAEAVVSGLLATDPDFARLEQLSANGSSIDPADGRFLSLLGLLKVRQGDVEGAQQYFINALAIRPTEIQALYNRFAYLLNKRQASEAMPFANVIIRRWPEQWTPLEPYLPALLSTPESVRVAAVELGGNRAVRSRLIQSLTADAARLPLARAMLEEWKANGVPLEELRGLSNLVSNSLFEAKDYDGAYFLFRSMLDSEQAAVTGYLHNPDFKAQPTANRFDWKLGSQPGSITSITPQGLQVRFRDSPVRYAGLSQFFRLPPGAYKLTANYSVKGLVAPKPLKLVIRCIGIKAELVELPIRTGTQAGISGSGTFEVPATSCTILQIRLINEFAALSWNNRYDGSVTLHGLSVERNGIAGG